MLNIYTNIEYNVPGDTYFAEDDGIYYLIYTEYNAGRDLYELTPMKELDMTSEDRLEIGQILYAETYNDVVVAIENYVSSFASSR